MAEWLARPKLLDVSRVDIRLPNLQLDRVKPEQPSPLINLFEQYRLVTTLVASFGRISEISDPKSVRVVQDVIETWLAELTPELHMQDPDTSWDGICSWLPVQRAQLHSFVLMARLTPLKKYMTSCRPATPSEDDSLLRSMAIDTSIDCVNAALRLHSIVSPLKVKFHFVFFALFDTATLICSALLHNHRRDLDRRPDLFDAVMRALNTLQEASKHSKCASQAFSILRWLISRTGSDEQHGPVQNPSTGTYATSMSGVSTQVGSSSSWASTNDLDIVLGHLQHGSWADFDLCGMEDIWDWNSLDL